VPGKEAIRYCSRICRDDRARLDARDGPGRLGKWQPGGMNLLGTEKVPESPDRAGEGASCIASGRAGDGGIKRRYPKIAAGGGMIGLGKGIGIVPSAVPAGAAARGKRAGGPGHPQRREGLENGRTVA